MRKWANVKWAAKHSVIILPPVTGRRIIIYALKMKTEMQRMNGRHSMGWVWTPNRQTEILTVLPNVLTGATYGPCTCQDPHKYTWMEPKVGADKNNNAATMCVHRGKNIEALQGYGLLWTYTGRNVKCARQPTRAIKEK